MKMPIKTFWMMSSNIDRIMAQSDMRSLTVSVCAQAGQEAVESYRKHLIIEVGSIVKLESEAASPIIDEVRDQEGFNELRGMTSLFR